jgi:hypothetical protein
VLVCPCVLGCPGVPGCPGDPVCAACPVGAEGAEGAELAQPAAAAATTRPAAITGMKRARRGRTTQKVTRDLPTPSRATHCATPAPGPPGRNQHIPGADGGFSMIAALRCRKTGTKSPRSCPGRPGASCGLIVGRPQPRPGGGGGRPVAADGRRRPTGGGRRAAAAGWPADRALSPFSRPFHHFPWDRTGQKPQLLTGTGERARKVVKGPSEQGRQAPPAGLTTRREGKPAATGVIRAMQVTIGTMLRAR